MPTNPGISEVQDKNGVIADIEAKRFDGTRTVNIQGDVTATQTWNGDSNTALTLNASIGAKKVTQDKIGDKAVGSGQMADGSVGLTQMDPNAMTSSATSGDTRLITAGGVRTEIDNAILNRGKDYGPMTPTQINAISETIPTGSTVHVTAAGTITDGDIEVRQGEDLKYYRSGDTHYWYSMDGDFKLKQQAKTSPTASGNAFSFIDSITQDENGEITATKKTVQDGTTSQKGVVQLEDSHSSTSTTKAATPNSVKEAYDLANTANTGLANKLDKTGDGKDVTATFTEASSRANIGTGEKLSVIFGKIKKWFSDLGTAAFKNVPASGNASSTEVVLGSDTRLSAGASAIQGVKVNNTTLKPDENKVVTVPLATTSADGAMSAADKTKLNNAATYTQSSGTAPVKVDEYGALTPVPMDSTPTASSTNLMTSGAIKTAMDGKQNTLPTTGTPNNTYAINIGGFSNRMRGATVSGATSGTGYYKLAKFKFDNFLKTYEGALLSIITRSGNQSIEGLISVSFSEWTTDDESGDIIGNVAILGTRGTELPTSMYDMYFIKTASNEYYLYAHIKKTTVIVTVNILNVDAGVNPANVLLVPEYVGSELPTNLKNLKLPYRKMVYGTAERGAVGSISIPVYIDANGEVTACTDDFARDSEVVTNVEYVANQSGGGGNLNKTINGTSTSVLTFMNDSEAVAIWNDAKTAAANAS